MGGLVMARLGMLVKNRLRPDEPTRRVIFLTRVEELEAAEICRLIVDELPTTEQQLPSKAIGMIGPFPDPSVRLDAWRQVNWHADVIRGRRLGIS